MSASIEVRACVIASRVLAIHAGATNDPWPRDEGDCPAIAVKVNTEKGTVKLGWYDDGVVGAWTTHAFTDVLGMSDDGRWRDQP